MSHSFKLAPMSPLFKGLTLVVLVIPLMFGILALVLRDRLMGIVFVSLLVLYAVVWLGCRPSRFVVSHHSLDLVFPAWRRNIPIRSITRVRVLNQAEFQQEFGWAIRIGVGGLWGGFGWLWTSRRGMLEFYISQTDRLILLERSTGTNLLITPDQPTLFIETVQAILSTP